MSDTDIINALLSSYQLRMNKAHHIKESQSSIGEKNELASLHVNPLHPVVSCPIIMESYQATYNLIERLDTPTEVVFPEKLKQGTCTFFVQEMQDNPALQRFNYFYSVFNREITLIFSWFTSL